MKYFINIILVSLLLPTIVAANGLDTKQEKWIQDRLNSKDIVGMAVARINGDTVELHTYGKRSVDDPRPLAPDSQFEIGSITKVFTNLLLAEMVAKGTLSHDTKLTELLPNIEFKNPAVGKITLLELGTHTSGLPRLPANLEMTNPADPYVGFSDQDLLDAIQSTRPDQELQKVVSYSNFGVGLLGYLLGEANNSSYFEALDTHILKPLGMNTITNIDTKLLLPGHSAGKLVSNWHIDTLAGAGALRSNVAQLSLLFTPWLSQKPNLLVHNTNSDLEIIADGGNQLSVSRAWMVLGAGEQKIYWHNGGTGGFSSFAGFNPVTREGWIVLSNSNYNITDFGLGLFATPPTQVVEDTEKTDLNYSDYYGFFAIAPDFVLSVFERQGKLFTQATGQAPLQMLATGEDIFTLLSVDAQLVFDRDVAGTVIRANLHQNGRVMPAPRVAKDTSIKKFTEIKVSEDALKAYTGNFELAPSAIFQVKVDAGQLMLRLADQPWLPVFAYEKDKFFYKEVDAQITFNLKEGAVVSLTLHQNGANQTATKR